MVLNHTEGFEASEFKHGPNTILGFNTVMGPLQVDALLKRLGHALKGVLSEAASAGLAPDSLARLVQAATDSVLSPASNTFSLNGAERAVLDKAVHRTEILDELYAD